MLTLNTSNLRAAPMAYNLARKSDRAALLAAVCDHCAPLGGTVTDQTPSYADRFLYVHVRHESGLHLSFTINGRHRDDSFCLSWHDAPRRMAPVFGGTNLYHGLKATWSAYGVLDLFDKLTRGLTMASDGSAFEEATP